MKLDISELANEIYFKTSRSSGSGGQNVNKVESKVSLFFNIEASKILNTEQKESLKEKLKNNINKDSEIIIHSEESRSQLKNKETALEKFSSLLAEALKKQKKRRSTKPSKAVVQKRLDEKKKVSEKKQNRNFNL